MCPSGFPSAMGKTGQPCGPTAGQLRALEGKLQKANLKTKKVDFSGKKIKKQQNFIVSLGKYWKTGFLEEAAWHYGVHTGWGGTVCGPCPSPAQRLLTGRGAPWCRRVTRRPQPFVGFCFCASPSSQAVPYNTEIGRAAPARAGRRARRLPRPPGPSALPPAGLGPPRPRRTLQSSTDLQDRTSPPAWPACPAQVAERRCNGWWAERRAGSALPEGRRMLGFEFFVG